MKIASADSTCSMVLWNARAACAEVSTGSVEALKSKHGPRLYLSRTKQLRLLVIDVQEHHA
jgi:hypothetical protein